MENRKNPRQDNHKKVHASNRPKPTDNSLNWHFPRSDFLPFFPKPIHSCFSLFRSFFARAVKFSSSDNHQKERYYHEQWRKEE
jgi:hypothetical protein